MKVLEKSEISMIEKYQCRNSITNFRIIHYDIVNDFVIEFRSFENELSECFFFSFSLSIPVICLAGRFHIYTRYAKFKNIGNTLGVIIDQKYKNEEKRCDEYDNKHQ